MDTLAEDCTREWEGNFGFDRYQNFAHCHNLFLKVMKRPFIWHIKIQVINKFFLYYRCWSRLSYYHVWYVEPRSLSTLLQWVTTHPEQYRLVQWYVFKSIYRHKHFCVITGHFWHLPLLKVIQNNYSFYVGGCSIDLHFCDFTTYPCRNCVGTKSCWYTRLSLSCECST